MANVLQWKVLDFVSNFLLVVVAVVVVAMWNALGVAEKGREAVKEEGGGGALLMRLTMIVMMVR